MTKRPGIISKKCDTHVFAFNHMTALGIAEIQLI